MNEDDSFRMLDDKDVFYVCMLLFMFALVFGGCTQRDPIAKEIQPQPLAAEKFKLGYPCETWIKQSGGDAKPIFSCVKASRE